MLYFIQNKFNLNNNINLERKQRVVNCCFFVLALMAFSSFFDIHYGYYVISIVFCLFGCMSSRSSLKIGLECTSFFFVNFSLFFFLEFFSDLFLSSISYIVFFVSGVYCH